MKKVAIIGYGWVGKAMKQLFPDAVVYDPFYKPQGTEFWPTFSTSLKEDVNKCDIAFICVPTPVLGEGQLDTSIVEECVSWLQCPLLVIRSTVNPGTCVRLGEKYSKNIVYQPEYLGETPAHPMLEMKDRPFMVLGGHQDHRKYLIDLYTEVYNANITITQLSLYEAEVVKLSENRAIAFKVAQCQELYDVAQKCGLDYYAIRDAVYGDDPRFTLWWTFVFPDKRGFNSKCIPKDVYAWCAWAESLGDEPKITRAILERNKEWITN